MSVPPHDDPAMTAEPSLDGHTIDQLSDYLDADRMPADPSIDNSPGCQLALAALVRLRVLAGSLLEDEASAQPARDDSWIQRILAVIGQESRAGRDIPLSHPSERASLSITEGAVRGLIRSVGDALGTLVIGRCVLVGDVTVPGEPITVAIDASAVWGRPVTETVVEARDAIFSALRLHTELDVVAVDITVHDIQRLADHDGQNV